MDDKLIEVVGMYSSLHIGTIQVSLSEPLRIGQASEVKVTLFVVIDQSQGCEMKALIQRVFVWLMLCITGTYKL